MRPLALQQLAHACERMLSMNVLDVNQFLSASVSRAAISTFDSFRIALQLAHFLRADHHIWATQICKLGLPALQACESRARHALSSKAALELLRDEHDDIVAAVLHAHPVLSSGWPVSHQLLALPTSLQLALLSRHVAANCGACELDIGAGAGLASVLPLLRYVHELTSVSLCMLRRATRRSKGRIIRLTEAMSALSGAGRLVSLHIDSSVCKETLASLPPLAGLTALRQLSFASVDARGRAGAQRALATAPALTGLELSYQCSASTRAVRKMAVLLASAASCLTSLRVNFYEHGFSIAHAERTAACFAKLRSLVELRIEGLRLGKDAEMNVIGALLSAPTALKTLHLQRSQQYPFSPKSTAF